MQVERCIELHNQILRHGWIGSGRSPDIFEVNCPKWFDHYGAEAEAVRSDLAPDLVEFLKLARIPVVPDAQFSLSYWVSDLAGPESMFEFEENFALHGDDTAEADDDDWGKRFVVLYTMNDFGSHRLGLVFDQKTHLSIISPTIWEMGTIFNGRMTWYPLETVLGAWLEEIRTGKVEAVPKDGGRFQLEYDSMSKNEPWVFIPYSDSMLEETIDVFNRLVAAIETRLPGASVGEDDNVPYGLVDERVLQNINLPQGFAYEFLQRARLPRFQMIAPGLEVPTSSSFSTQPFWSTLVDGTGEIPPVLLFRSKHDYGDDSLRVSIGQWDAPFHYPHNEPSLYAAGIYLSPRSISKSATEDEVRLILPFGIGANGYARMSDGERFGWNRENQDKKAKDIFADLYRPGYQPFREMSEHRLVSVLKNWLGMVERGDWKIDQSGVAGGIDVWKEADMEQGWEKYVIPLLEI